MVPSTIENIEFINLEESDISPFISKCQIKVLYLGKNRNGTDIDKSAALKMAKTLRGNPIVGYYKEEKEDFRDHGESITLEDGEVVISCKTRPYGFVAPNADVWFKDFEEINDFGERVIRTYMLTNGFLWTGQYPECQSVIDDGKGQSMEIDKDSVKGYWSEDFNSDMEFYIISDAAFSKLCILGDDVEPCFEGANITAAYSKVNKEFTDTLYKMMQDLKNYSLKGGFSEMDNDNLIQNNDPVAEPVVTEPVANVEPQSEPVVEPVVTDDPVEPNAGTDNNEPAPEPDPTPVDTDPAPVSYTQEDMDAEKAKYDELNTKYEDLSQKYEVLLQFKQEYDNQQKDALIDKFSMIDDADEDKQKILSDRDNLSYDELESKLSVLCFRKGINFNSIKEEKEDSDTNEPPVTYSIVEDTNMPDFIRAIESVKNNK